MKQCGNLLCGDVNIPGSPVVVEDRHYTLRTGEITSIEVAGPLCDKCLHRLQQTLHGYFAMTLKAVKAAKGEIK